MALFSGIDVDHPAKIGVVDYFRALHEFGKGRALLPHGGKAQSLHLYSRLFPQPRLTEID